MRRVLGRTRTTRSAVLLVACGLAVSTCSTAGDVVTTRSADAAPTTTTTTTTTTTSTTTTTAPPATTTTAAPPPSPVVDRDHVLTGYAPYATVGAVTLGHPAAIVELIGLHQSNHEGAQDQAPVEGTTWAIELQTRGRATGPRTAADIVTQPDSEIRSPVTGVVARAERYVLYCNIEDEFLVITPDDNPALEVKLLHVQGLAVAAGDRVVAGETVVAARAHELPFRSQVDRRTADPSWPHVHIEVVDPSIPNVPNGGTGNEEC